MTWRYDIETAPKDRQIIAAGHKGVVTVSQWQPKEGRWSMFTKDVPPFAWQPWPKHPHDRPKPAIPTDVFG